MACKYNYTFEERPQRCLECKEPMCQARDHFPDIAEGSVFPVWVRVERINEKV